MITKQLQVGTTDPQVKELQKLLNQLGFKVSEFGVGSPGKETDYYGPKTQAAVQEFQEQYGIASRGVLGYGRVGPKTLTQIKQIQTDTGKEGFGTITKEPESIIPQEQLRGGETRINPQTDNLEVYSEVQKGWVPQEEITKYAPPPGTEGVIQDYGGNLLNVVVQGRRLGDITDIDDLASPRVDFNTGFVSSEIYPSELLREFALASGLSPNEVLGAWQNRTQPITQKSNLPPEIQDLYDIAKNYLDALTKKGQTINPYVEITPEKTAEFLSQAEQEISPYYQSQFRLAKDNFLKSVGYATEDILRQEQDLERQYGRQLTTLGETVAEQGLSYSGIRQKGERELAEATQREIETGRRKLQFGAEQEAGKFAQQYGYQGLPELTIGQAPRVLPGEGQFEKLAHQGALYQLSPETYEGLVGEKQFEEQAQKRIRVAEKKKAFTQSELAERFRQLEL